MLPILDHIDTLIASDFYEENNQPLLSQAMKLLNRPNLEFSKYIVNCGSATESRKTLKNWSASKTRRTDNRHVSVSKASGKNYRLKFNYKSRSRSSTDLFKS